MPVNQMPKSIDPQANLFECLARDAVEDALVCGFATSATDLPEVGVLQCSLDEKELFLVVEDQSASCDLVVLRALERKSSAVMSNGVRDSSRRGGLG